MKSRIVVFDLDDTLYQELDFLKSAYKEIASFVDENYMELSSVMIKKYLEGDNVFDFLVLRYPHITKEKLLTLYREHYPSINLNVGALDLLSYFKTKQNIKLALITDGRSITQRNKIKSLGLLKSFSEILISEEIGVTKEDSKSFEIIQEKHPQAIYYYIGDNLEKDFYYPNKFGWVTICLKDRGNNIHKQNFDKSILYLPKYVISSLEEIKEIIK